MNKNNQGFSNPYELITILVIIVVLCAASIYVWQKFPVNDTGNISKSSSLEPAYDNNSTVLNSGVWKKYNCTEVGTGRKIVRYSRCGDDTCWNMFFAGGQLLEETPEVGPGTPSKYEIKTKVENCKLE